MIQVIQVKILLIQTMRIINHVMSVLPLVMTRTRMMKKTVGPREKNRMQMKNLGKH